ncbi:MAG TPA: hypothetical protein VF095_03490 [Bacillota bacterium]
MATERKSKRFDSTQEVKHVRKPLNDDQSRFTDAQRKEKEADYHTVGGF